MITPQRAPVRPRVTTPESGEPIALEHKIVAMLSAGFRDIIYLCGPAGSGKTTALQHLAAVLPADVPLALFDGVAAIHPKGFAVCGVESLPLKPRGTAWQLAPWTDDDLIEYLLAVHHDRCADILARMPDRQWLGGIPQLCTIVLEELARDASIVSARAALLGYLHRLFPEPHVLERARTLCLDLLTDGGLSVVSPRELSSELLSPDRLGPLRHTQVQHLLAAERVAADLEGRRPCDYLALRLPRGLVQAIAERIVNAPAALSYLEELLGGAIWSHAMAASLLHAARENWVPRSRSYYVLSGAYLNGVSWPAIDLSGLSNLRETDLSRANLAEAKLDDVNAGRANLRQANLARASINSFRAIDADLTNADLTQVSGEHTRWDGASLTNANLTGASLTDASFLGSDLSGARLNGAILSRAVFTGARLTNADFSGAILHLADLAGLRLRDAIFREARLPEANLSNCDMEEMDLPGAELLNANLARSLLTGANLSGANLRGASLRGAGLAEVNLVHADLRNADLGRATFHMGSSRSGLVDSSIASEGSRTGFYTDDADEQGFKAPEEIRKANLCFTDLRGAHVTHTDFYLVDLRGAVYDPEQEAHFRRCRAILD